MIDGDPFCPADCEHNGFMALEATAEELARSTVPKTVPPPVGTRDTCDTEYRGKGRGFIAP